MIVVRMSRADLIPTLLNGKAEVNHERSAGIIWSWVLEESSSSSEPPSFWDASVICVVEEIGVGHSHL